jgi:hypothetical protein
MAKYNLTPDQRQTFTDLEQMSAAAGDPTMRFTAGRGFEGVRGAAGQYEVSRMDIQRFEELKLMDVSRPSASFHPNLRIESTELDSRVGCLELPVDLLASLVPISVPD